MSDEPTALDVVRQGAMERGETALTAWGTGGGVQWLAEYERMAQLVSKAITLPQAYQGDPRTVLAVALAGKELGLGFMESTRLFHVIQGQPVLSAQAMVRLALGKGHAIRPAIRVSGYLEVWCETHDSHHVGWALDHSTGEDAARGSADAATDVSITVAAEVLQGGKPLTSKEVWKSYPQQMLWARATSQLIREHCPEVIGGLYAREEIE